MAGAQIPVDGVKALLRAAGEVGLVAVRGDGGPTVDLFLKDGALCVGVKGRMNGGRRNLGDVDGGVIEISVVVPPGRDGPDTALIQVQRAVEAVRVPRKAV